MIELGQKLKRRIKIYDPAAGGTMSETTVDAEVIWIHPELRFYTILCRMPGGRSFRETEYFYPRCGMDKN